MDSNPMGVMSEEEEDLAALRLAALQTLKKVPNSNENVFNSLKNEARPKSGDLGFSYRSGNGAHTNKRGRYYGHRGTKNSQFHVRPISSNLISLTPALSSEAKLTKEVNSDSNLILPQDKYCNKVDSESDKIDEKGSKFDRYKDSDDSEDEDTEDELLKSDLNDDSPLKITRSDSLEALMQELDDEIQGKIKPKDSEEKSETKLKVKRRKNENEVKNEKPSESIQLAVEEETKKKKEEVKSAEGFHKEVKSAERVISIGAPKRPTDSPEPEPKPILKKSRLMPPFKREFRGGSRGNNRKFQRVTSTISNRSTINPAVHFTAPVYPIPPFAPVIMMNPAPFFNARPMSPLHLNAETLQNQTLAPLSPRSAAFVLQNRAIIEKRKRSPRRSYSRSPSPRNLVSPRRRSLSPRSPLRRRSLTPIRRRSPSPFKKRSLSPLRKRSPRRRSLSPKRKSPRPLSPKQRDLSPKRSPRRRSLSPSRRRDRDRKVAGKPIDSILKIKPSIRERLGIKSLKPEEKEAPKEKPLEKHSPEKAKPLDPVLEARKKKFESKEIKIKEGVIRLKPKAEFEDANTKNVELKSKGTLSPMQQTKVDDVLNEDLLMEYDELELGAEHTHLFSDEESGSDNEGRFKTKETLGEKSTVISLKKMVHGPEVEVHPEIYKEERPKRPRSRSQSSDLKMERKATENHSTKSQSSRSSARKKFAVKSERHPKKFERKIEIKIKNLSKYKDREEKGPIVVDVDDLEPRKVELDGDNVDKNEFGDDDDETEIVIEHDCEVENTSNSEGDLRAQLSKKRAEKLQHRSVVSREGVSSRLLQTALKNALPVKKPKKSKKKELSNGEGKVPIHLRLGVSYDSDMFTTKPKKKSKKRKNIDTEEQV